MATVETRTTQDPWIRWAKLPRKLHWIWTLFVVHAATLVNLSSILILEDVLKDRLGKVIPISLEPLHLLWMKSALHPSSGPPTDASCSCMLLPVCSQALLSEDVAKANLGHRQNFNGAALNGAKLAGWQEVPVSMVVLFPVQSVNLNMSALELLRPSVKDLAIRRKQSWTQDRLVLVWSSFSCRFIGFTCSATLLLLTCGVNGVFDELPWLDLQ